MHLMGDLYKKITFLSKFANLEIKLNFKANFLNEIEFSEKTRNFAYLEGFHKNVILSKYDDKSDVFDIICYVSWNIKKKLKFLLLLKKIGRIHLVNLQN